jgi:hypothetical protein
MNRVLFVFLSSILILNVVACDQSDGDYEIGRQALEGESADQAQSQTRWGVYRDQIVEGLDLMKGALTTVREQATVFDQKEIDGLLAHVGALRDEMASKVDAPTREEQAQLRAHFVSVRRSVDALLNRLDYDPDEVARWQDKT